MSGWGPRRRFGRWHMLGAGAGMLAVLVVALIGGRAVGAGGLGGPRATPTKAGPQIRVQIDGAIATPGVYRLSQDDRVEELVKAAGGFARDADQAKVNLAQRLSDAQRITIPALPTATPPPTATRPPATATVPATPTAAATPTAPRTPTVIAGSAPAPAAQTGG
jgi:competence protein ComEA